MKTVGRVEAKLNSERVDRYGTREQCAEAQALISPQLVAQAKEVRENIWDWHPNASLAKEYMLVAFDDGVWIIHATVDLNQATKLARVGESWN